MNIYIIANNLNLSENDINRINSKINLKDDDLIIRMNSFPIILNKLLFGKTTHLYYRCGKNFCHTNRFNNFLGNDKDINYGIIMWKGDNEDLLKKIIYDSNKVTISEYMYIQDELYDLLKDSPSTGITLIFNYLKKYKNANIYLVGFTFENEGNSDHANLYKAHSFDREVKIIEKLQKITNRLYFLN
jgi:hypothetical protein